MSLFLRCPFGIHLLWLIWFILNFISLSGGKLANHLIITQSCFHCTRNFSDISQCCLTCLSILSFHCYSFGILLLWVMDSSKKKTTTLKSPEPSTCGESIYSSGCSYGALLYINKIHWYKSVPLKMCLYFRLSTANLLRAIFINFFIVYIFWGIFFF